MVKTDITKPAEISVSRPLDIFVAMRDEMDRMFERIEHGFPRWPSLFRRGYDRVMVPELDVRENTNSITIEAELPGVEEKDVSVTLTNGTLTIKGGEEAEQGGDKRELLSVGAQLRRIRAVTSAPRDH